MNDQLNLIDSVTPIISTNRQDKLLKSGRVISDSGPSDDEIAYMHTIMCQVGLPRSKVEASYFERVCGAVVLRVSAGVLFDGEQFIEQMVPYGANPRLIMAYLNTQAVRYRTQEVEIGDSAQHFMRMLGKQSSGGKNGSYTSFMRQLQALSACRLTLGYQLNGKAHTYNGQPVREFSAWIDGPSHQRTLWPGTIKLSDEYYNTLIEHAVPQDIRAMYSLKGSALAMDIYSMLAERLYRIKGKEPLILRWRSLRLQFGQEYRGKEADKDFKKAFIAALKKVQVVYPKAKVSVVDTGIRLFASPPPVLPLDTRKSFDL